MQSGYRVTYNTANSYTFDSITGKFALNYSGSIYWNAVRVGQYIATANTNMTQETDNLSSVCRVESTDNNTITCRTITAVCR